MKKEAWEHMMKVSRAMWVRSHFKIDTQSDLQVNNICETSIYLLYKTKKSAVFYIFALLKGIFVFY